VVTYEKIQGRPFEAHGYRLVPWTERFRLRLPGGRGGLVWSRALAIEVEKDGRDLGLWRIRDRTRHAEYLFLAAGVLGFLAAVSLRRR
jgi:hypothetical protein